MVIEIKRNMNKADIQQLLAHLQMQLNLPLVTADKDFKHVDELTLNNH